MPAARVSTESDGADEEAGMARDHWEHCNVSYGSKEVNYYTIAGVRTEKMRDFPQAVADLGQQGWELAAILTAVLWFKRRIES